MVPKPENKLTAWYVNEPEKVLDAQGIKQIMGDGAEIYETSSYEDAIVTLECIRQRKKIRYEDRLHLSPHKEDYVSMIDMFRREHKHPDEEVRYFERGTGFLDVRDKSDRWLRVQVRAGHLLVLPPQIYHRFSPATQQEELVIHRLFEDVDAWTADFRDEEGDQ
uniref:acireductone dioxygenase (Fe(2+)-requiring) n=1 Tax=Rhipicephalus microplus TaxID=6941 RepID=A0A6M2CHI9_RHIMP